MEKYFENSAKIYYETGKLPDARPEGGYQTGVLPHFTERARKNRRARKTHIDDPVIS